MVLALQNQSAMVQNMAAAAQGVNPALTDFEIGSVELALVEGSAANALWLQWLIVQLMMRQRLSTSFGDDVDTFVGDYSLTRLPGVSATGAVTLTRFFATESATVLVGSNVKTGDGSQTFTITADTTNGLYSAAVTDPSGNVVGGYIIPANTASATVPIQAQVVGTVGNVSANTITLLATGISGVDTVTNSLGLTNGLDAESDAELKARFVNYIASLSKATQGAIAAAIAGVQQGLTFSIAANTDTDGTFKPGKFTVTIDDGTGSPPGSLLTLVSNAIQPVRSLCETFAVQGPAVQTVPIVLTITVAAGYVKANIIGPVAQAITAYVNTLPIGVSLPFSRIASLAYGVSPGITNVSSITVNGTTADITVTASGAVKTSGVTVN